MLANTLVANVTSSYLWFALTFWAYLETRSVMATAIIGGGFMLFTAVVRHLLRHAGRPPPQEAGHGRLLDGHPGDLRARPAVCGCCSARSRLADWESPWFWLFAAVILVGGVVESLRNIALSTTVTLLVPEDGRDKANGLVGTVQGIAFMITSVFSGLSVGLLGMGWTLAIAIALTGASLLHLMPISIPELDPEPEEGGSRFDVRGAVAAIRAVPGLVALILFSTFNNLVSGVYIALMDPYGLTLFSVEAWGIVLGVTGLGFVVGGGLVAKFGLGANPVRTLLLVNLGVAVLGHDVHAARVGLALRPRPLRLHGASSRPPSRPSRRSCSGWCRSAPRAACSASRRASSSRPARSRRS